MRHNIAPIPPHEHRLGTPPPPPHEFGEHRPPVPPHEFGPGHRPPTPPHEFGPGHHPPTPPHEHVPGHPRPPLPAQSLNASGAISSWLVGPHGEARGFILSDGTEVLMPPPVSSVLMPQLKIGENVSVQGYGVSNDIGACLDLANISINGRSVAF